MVSEADQAGVARNAGRNAGRLLQLAQRCMLFQSHTADGLKVARDVLKAGKVKKETAMIVLETALPIKFAATIVEALGTEPDRPAKFEGIEVLPKRVVNMPADVAQLKAFIAKQCA